MSKRTILILVSLLITGALFFPNVLAYQQPDKAKLLAMFQAIDEDNIGQVDELLSQGISPNAEITKEVTAEIYYPTCLLKIAVEKDRYEISRRLLNAGANPNPYDNDSGLVAQAVKNPALVKLLLQAGARVNRDGSSQALYAAAGEGNMESIDLILKAGALINSQTNPPLTNAARGGHLEVVKLLVSLGAKVNQDAFSGTPSALMMAADGGHTEVVRFLLKKGADANTRTSYGNSALMGAINGEHAEIVKLLTDAGAKLDPVNHLALTEGLDLAKQFGNELEKTRDFTTLIDKYFVKKFPANCPSSNQRFVLYSIDSAPFEPDLFRETPPDLLQRFFIAQLNCNHLVALQTLTRKEEDEEGNTPPDEITVKIEQMLKKNECLKSRRLPKTKAELIDLTNTYEQVTQFLRDYFRGNPPEQNADYLEYLKNGNTDEKGKSEFYQIEIFYDGGLGCEMTNSAGEQVNQEFPYVLIKVPPFYEIGLVRFSSGFKISSIGTFSRRFEEVIIGQSDVLEKAEDGSYVLPNRQNKEEE